MQVSGTYFSVSLCSLQHTATHCNTLQHTATYCDTLQYAKSDTAAESVAYLSVLSATCCNKLQHAATQCNTLQHAATHGNTRATHCNTLQHTVNHCNTLQSTQAGQEAQRLADAMKQKQLRGTGKKQFATLPLSGLRRKELVEWGGGGDREGEATLKMATSLSLFKSAGNSVDTMHSPYSVLKSDDVSGDWSRRTQLRLLV